MITGELGKLVTKLFPNWTYSSSRYMESTDPNYRKRFKALYDSDPDREFDGSDRDKIHGTPAMQDILILKNNSVSGYLFKPVIAVKGSSMKCTVDGPKLFYNIQVYAQIQKHDASFLDVEISPGIKLNNKEQSVLKSDIEDFYIKVDTAMEAIFRSYVILPIEDVLKTAVTNAHKRYG